MGEDNEKKPAVLFDLDDFAIYGDGGVIGTTYRRDTQTTQCSGHKFRQLQPDVGSVVGILKNSFFGPSQIEAVGIVTGVQKFGRDKQYDVYVCASDPYMWKSQLFSHTLEKRGRDDVIPVGVKTGISGMHVVFFKSHALDAYEQKYGMDSEATRAFVEKAQAKFKQDEAKERQALRKEKLEQRTAKKMKLSE